MRALALVALLLISGCAAPDTQPSNPSSTEPTVPIAVWCEGFGGTTPTYLGDYCACRMATNRSLAYCAESWGESCPAEAAACESGVERARAACPEGSGNSIRADVEGRNVTFTICGPTKDQIGVSEGPRLETSANGTRIAATVVSSWTDARAGQEPHRYLRVQLSEPLPPGHYSVEVALAYACDECAPQYTVGETLKADFEVA